MKKSNLSAWLIQLLLIATCLLSWAPAAHADVIDTMATILETMEKNGIPKPTPFNKFTAQDLRDSKSLISCIANGSSAQDCLVNAGNTPLAAKASDGYIPKIIELYSAIDNGEVDKIVSILGEQVLCIVSSIIITAGTVDICGLLEDLVKVAESVYDAAKWLVNVLGDAFGGLVDALGCLFGCDDGPAPPEEYYVYEYIYKAKINEGATDIEQSQQAFTQLLNQLSANATHAGGAILTTPFPTLVPLTKWPTPFSKAAVATAETAFIKAVYARWSADMTTKHFLEKLSAERGAYDSNTTAAALAKDAANSYIKQSTSDAHAWFNNQCVSHFTGMGFQQIDRWLMLVSGNPGMFPAQAQQLAATMKSNAAWCSHFWGTKKSTVTSTFHAVTKAQLCPEYSGQLTCQSLAKYKTCAGLMGAVYQQQQCHMNVQYVGKDVATEIKNYFIKSGSKYACDILAQLSTPTSTSPATLRCHRPAQLYHCNKYYQEHYASGANKLPLKVLQCELGALQPASYQATEDKTWNSMIPALISQHNDIQPYVAQKGYDPLLIGVPNTIYQQYEDDAKALGFQSKVLMSFEPSIDGESVPTLAMSLEGAIKNAKNTVPVDVFKFKPGGVNPPDPVDQLSSKLAGSMVAPAGMPVINTMPALGQTKVMSGQAPGGAETPKPGGFAAQSPSQATLAMQAKPVLTSPGSGVASGQLPQLKPMSAGLPDISIATPVLIAGKAVSRSGTLAIDAAQAKQRVNGECQFEMQYVLRNLGAAPAAAFASQLRLGATSGPVHRLPGLAVNSETRQNDMLLLKPGANTLVLVVDEQNQLHEADRQNNQLRMVVNVTGNCGAAARQLPAVQQPPGNTAPRLSLPAR